MDADDRRVLELRVRLAEQACALARRHGNDDGVCVEVVERLDALAEADAVAEHQPGGVTVHRAERPHGQDEVRVRPRA